MIKQTTLRNFWDDVHLYENSIKKTDEGLYKELLFIDRILWPAAMLGKEDERLQTKTPGS